MLFSPIPLGKDVEQDAGQECEKTSMWGLYGCFRVGSMDALLRLEYTRGRKRDGVEITSDLA